MLSFNVAIIWFEIVPLLPERFDLPQYFKCHPLITLPNKLILIIVEYIRINFIVKYMGKIVDIPFNLNN